MARLGTKWRYTGLAYLFLAPALLLLITFVLYPVMQGFRLSFFQYDPYTQSGEYLGLENYRRMWSDPEFRVALLNSFRYLIVVPIIIVLSLALAVLVEPLIPGIHFFRAAYYIPVVTTMVVVGITWRFIFSEDDGLLNMLLSRWGVIESAIPWMTNHRLVLGTVMMVTIWKGLGYYMVVFIAALRSIPVELIEAAIVDGARPRQLFWRVKLPLLWPAITLVGVISSISALQVFDEIFVMTGGKIREAITLVYYIYETGFDAKIGPQDYGYASAMSVVLFLILVAFTALNLFLMKRGGYGGE
ncbi:MAG: sugar ABC transporter permease [Candidatus Sumerlaeaceae bacterium]|nr:sugar ABC transporter permease [Candidatus Sumerlaeaceae bacterium]